MTNRADNIILNRIKLWIPVILWMLVIFLFSSQHATESSELSGSITEWVISLISKYPLVDVLGEDLLHTLIRKCAHLTIYLILGVMVCRSFSNEGLSQCQRTIIALTICAIYAATDEFHQLHIPGRSGQFTDVLIDSCGAFIGITSYNTILKRRS